MPQPKNMENVLVLLVLAIAIVDAGNHPRVTETVTRNLRGGRVTHRREYYPDKTEEGLKPENMNKLSPLVDHPHRQHHGHAHGHLSMHKISKDGHLKHVDIDLEHYKARTDLSPQMMHNIEDFIADHQEEVYGYDEVELTDSHVDSDVTPSRSNNSTQQQNRLDHSGVKEVIVLPTRTVSHYNQSLYHGLLTAPFDIYSEIFHAHTFDTENSFPVFAIPSWQNRLGTFSGFGKVSESFIFENLQFLLQWKDILSASDGVSMELYEYMSTTHFESNLIIARGHKGSNVIPHLALVVTYYQFGMKKKVMIPFARISDFFDDTSEKHLVDEEVKEMEMEALHEMIQSKRSNSTLFTKTTIPESADQAEGYSTIEILHFQKLFQLLIRRSFLFSFGYVDCLMQDQPDNLRKCIDDTFMNTVKLETSVRGALDDQIVEMIAVVEERSNFKRADHVCAAFQNNKASIYDAASCSNMLDLGSVVISSLRSELR